MKVLFQLKTCFYGAREVAPEVAKIIGGELGWGVKERNASVKTFLALVEQEEEALNELVNS